MISVFAMNEETLLEIVPESDVLEIVSDSELLEVGASVSLRHERIIPWQEAYLFKKGYRDGKKTCVFIWPVGKESERSIFYEGSDPIGMAEVFDDRHFSYDPDKGQVVYLASFVSPTVVSSSTHPEEFPLMKRLLRSYGKME